MLGYNDIQYQTTIGRRDKCQPKMNGPLWRFHTFKKALCENNSYKETFVHECNALEFGIMSSQKEVNNDNFSLFSSHPAHEKLSSLSTSLQLPPQELGVVVVVVVGGPILSPWSLGVFFSPISQGKNKLNSENHHISILSFKN